MKKLIKKIYKNIDLVFLSIIITSISSMIYYFVLKTSTFVRLYGDDYCTSAMLKNVGYWQAQINWYNTWSGRFTYNLFVHFSEMLGIWFVRILPVVLFTVLFLSFALVLYRIYKKSFMSCLVLSAFIISLIVFNSPNIHQTLYWQTGSLTYLIPFIFLNLISVLLIKYWNSSKKINIKTIVLIFILAVIAGGFSESYVVLQICIFSCLFLMSLVKYKIKSSNKLILNAAPLVGSVISMLIVIVAPGNKIRQSMLPKSQGVFDIIKDTLLGTGQYLYSFFSNSIYLMSFFIVLAVGLYYMNRVYRPMKIDVKTGTLLVLIVVFVVTAAVASIYAPGIYALSELPPERTLSMAVYVMIIAAFAIGSIIGCVFNYYLTTNIISKFTTIWGVSIAMATVILFPLILDSNRVIYNEVRDYGVSWDKQEEDINKQLELNFKQLEITWIEPIGELPDPQPTEDGWVNRCMSDYFKVNSITAIKK